MKRTRLSWLAAGAAAALVLSACAGAGEADDGGATAEAPPAESPAGEAVEISFQTWNLMNERFTPYFEALIGEFESQHEGVTVRWIDHPAAGFNDSLAADAAAGTLADVMNLGPAQAFMLASAGHLVDLAELDPGAEARFQQAPWDALTFEQLGGGTFAYPWYLNSGPSFWNTAMLAECGLDPDAVPDTWEELFAQGAVLSENCPGRRMITSTPVIANFGEAGVQLMNEDHTEFTLNEPLGVEFLQHFIDLFDAGGMTLEGLDALDTDHYEGFVAGEVAWMAGSAMDLRQMREDAPDVYENVVMTSRINSSAPNMWMHSIAVNANAANQEAALAFARFVTDSANQLEFAKLAAVFPASADGLDDPWFTEEDGTPDARVRVQTARYIPESVVWQPVTFLPPEQTELREQIALAIIGQQTAQEALDNVVNFANQRLATAGS